jgi:hypothetical protein
MALGAYEVNLASRPARSLTFFVATRASLAVDDFTPRFDFAARFDLAARLDVAGRDDLAIRLQV